MVNHYSQHQSHWEGLLSQAAGPTLGCSDAGACSRARGFAVLMRCQVLLILLAPGPCFEDRCPFASEFLHVSYGHSLVTRPPSSVPVFLDLSLIRTLVITSVACSGSLS